ncbi:hypothetical protein [Bacteriovorax sp. Seq25_V]|uniref:hypothetical protein n=1 Tax=Bacteriovorax sp. Seq25_V TaxID=1201288 RepID=UPI000389DCE1|nr:hypothetical protein [Bacteriovorax sp. Seq25_V]EQC46899.1 hypothetical protein M900_2556 [Bacteriovorax sp. Seq25_V]
MNKIVLILLMSVLNITIVKAECSFSDAYEVITTEKNVTLDESAEDVYIALNTNEENFYLGPFRTGLTKIDNGTTCIKYKKTAFDADSQVQSQGFGDFQYECKIKIESKLESEELIVDLDEVPGIRRDSNIVGSTFEGDNYGEKKYSCQNLHCSIKIMWHSSSSIIKSVGKPDCHILL